MSNLADHELATLRRERDEARKQLGQVLYLTKAPSTQALVDGYLAAGRLRESQRMLLHDAVDHGRNHTAELVDCEDMSCAQARAALEPAPGPAGERQEAVVEVDEDSDLHKLFERHPLP